MTVNSTPLAGVSIDTAQLTGEGREMALGTSVLTTTGRKAVLVQASAAIAALAAGREVTITEPGFTAATGAGGFIAPPNVAIASGERFFAQQKALA